MFHVISSFFLCAAPGLEGPDQHPSFFTAFEPCTPIHTNSSPFTFLRLQLRLSHTRFKSVSELSSSCFYFPNIYMGLCITEMQARSSCQQMGHPYLQERKYKRILSSSLSKRQVRNILTKICNPHS